MARPKNMISIADLEKMLDSRKSDLIKLQSERATAAKKLHEIDQQISKLGGTTTAANGSAKPSQASVTPVKTSKSGKRAKNTMSLTEALASVLKGKEPMAIADIVTGVEAAGYKSSSANFRGIVNQTLIKEKQFTSRSRGLYELK